MRVSLKYWLIGGLLLTTAVYALAEDITLTTYYPSPRGVYQELKTAGNLIVGDITNPPAARLHVVQQGTAPALRVDDEASDLSPFVISDTGNVGIGTASPGAKLTVAGTIESSADGVKFPDSTVQTTASPWAASATDISNTNTGNVGIGTATPAGKLDVAGNVIAAAPAGFTVAGTPPASFTQDGSGNAQVFTSATERLRITAAGNVGIGTTAPATKLDVVGNINATSLTTPSSATVKTDIVPLSSDDYVGILETLNNTRVFRYHFKEHESFVTKPHIGVIAEEAPTEITTENRQGISYADYLGFLLAALKAQQEEIRQLKEALKR